MDDRTCKASAQFLRFTANLRSNHRAKIAAVALKDRMTGVVLRDWQEEIRSTLDECAPCPAPTIPPIPPFYIKEELLWNANSVMEPLGLEPFRWINTTSLC